MSKKKSFAKTQRELQRRREQQLSMKQGLDQYNDIKANIGLFAKEYKEGASIFVNLEHEYAKMKEYASGRHLVLKYKVSNGTPYDPDFFFKRQRTVHEKLARLIGTAFDDHIPWSEKFLTYLDVNTDYVAFMEGLQCCIEIVRSVHDQIRKFNNPDAVEQESHEDIVDFLGEAVATAPFAVGTLDDLIELDKATEEIAVDTVDDDPLNHMLDPDED